MNAPRTLNDYEVIRAKVHANCVTVMVHRVDDDAYPYVVATWWPELGT